MGNLILPIIEYLERLSQHVPLEVFTIVGTFLEEVIAPIPSPFVLTTAGSITAAQNNPLSYILFIALLGAISKTFGGWLLYVLFDKGGDFLVDKIGKFLGVTKGEIEKIGSYLNGGWKEKVILFVLRALPMAPSSPISITCGLIKLNMKTFLVTTFFGTIIRNLSYLYLGYTGLAASKSVASGLERSESIGQIVVIAAIVIFLIWGFLKRKKIFGGNGEDLLKKYSHAITPEIRKEYSENTILKALQTLTYHHPDHLPKKQSNKHSTIYIFRHGQSEDNKNFIFSGWRKAPLTDVGKEQAKVLTSKLKNIRFGMIVSSPQIRATETLEIALSKNESIQNLEVITDRRIMERSYGDLQGQSKLEAYLKDPEGLKKIRRTWDGTPPNGESIEMVYKRVSEFCDELIPKIKGKNINVAISCHGNSIRCFRGYFENLSHERIATVETPLGQDYAAYTIKD
ncbi:histidine phosphatase family protein [Patescibacteria group bacterium]